MLRELPLAKQYQETLLRALESLSEIPGLIRTLREVQFMESHSRFTAADKVTALDLVVGLQAVDIFLLRLDQELAEIREERLNTATTEEE